MSTQVLQELFVVVTRKLAIPGIGCIPEWNGWRSSMLYDHVQPISISAGKTFALSITLKAIPGWKPPILVVKKTGKTPFY